MPTIQQLAAKMNQDAVNTLIRNVRAMPEDKLTWQPLENGRTVLSQLQECAVVAGFTTETLQTLALPSEMNDSFGRLMGELDTVEKAVAKLEENAASMVAEIEAFPDADLEKTVKFPWHTEPSSMAEVMFMTYWNTVYHGGQVCYIQTLYGDKEMH